ncbi:MAG: hypothetical protein C4524_09950 [Candidatus Zixiibacteriota bacterium]|nr:MAG: hypothetical protein C4524_09950 [candidate division Zixibacteria bacterium]
MPVQGIIIAHANLAQALISTVEQIAGRQEDLCAISNTELSNEDLDRTLRECLAGGQPVVFFTDFNAGSTYAVARRVVDSHCQISGTPCCALTGVNLPMLLSFVMKRDTMPFLALTEALREDGHRGIQKTPC